MLGAVDQEPDVTLRTSPSSACDAREIRGGLVATSAARAGATGPARLAWATEVPVRSVARSISPIVLPWSSGPSRYIAPFAPSTGAQFTPKRSQRDHWNAKLTVPTPRQRPVAAISSEPAARGPVTCGTLRGTGPRSEAATTAGLAVLNVFWIVAALAAWTSTRSACPRSAALMR